MDFWTWIASGFEQQQSNQDNVPTPPSVTVSPLPVDGTLDLPDWNPSAAEIPATVADPMAVDAYKIFGAGLHDEFSEDNLALAFNAAYVMSSSRADDVKFWSDEDGYILVESDTMPGTYHVFKAAPQQVYLDIPMPDAAGAPQSDETTAPDTVDALAPSSAPVAATPSPKATKKTTAAVVKTPKTTTVVVKRTASSPAKSATPTTAPVQQAAQPQAQITSRSPLFRPWAQSVTTGATH